MVVSTVHRDTSGFAERLLELVDVGRRTATYKLAVLLSLIDLCTTLSDESGRAPQILRTRDVAEQVASLYWRQVAPYRVALRQIRNDRSKILDAVEGFRQLAGGHGASSLHLARRALPAEYEQMIDQVEMTVAEQPIPRLQTVGSSDEVFPFIFEIDWGPREVFRLSRLRSFGDRGPELRMCAGAGDELVRLAPLIRPLVELHWTRMVAELSGIALEEADLHRFLFGRDRLVPPPLLREAMAAWQSGRCFYCHGRLRSEVEADHFVARARGGRDAIENLVLADRGCNGDKRELLAAPPLVRRWAARNLERGSELVELAQELRWDLDPAGTPAIARAIYSHLPAGPTPMWWSRGNVRSGRPEEALAALGPGWPSGKSVTEVPR